MKLQQSPSSYIKNNKEKIPHKQTKKSQVKSFLQKAQTKQNSPQISYNIKQDNKSKINIALVSDFYYPFVGGVQIHIKQLATLLSKHQRIGNVIVITHKYQHHSSLIYTGKRNQHGFNVYYMNIHYNKQHMIIYPTFVFNFRAAAKILQGQCIDIVHCHQTGSTLALQFIFFARILGIRVVLTQHSLYGLRSIEDIHFNRVSRLFLPFCDKIIAVSKTTRNNLILRAKLDPKQVVVIPNGVSNVQHIKKRIKQQKVNQNKNQSKSRIIKIISVGRMTYRRGTDLLIQILPHLCKQHVDIQILIAGDGIKRKALQEIIQIYNLHNQVRLLGIISDHEKLLQKMAECDIFLNTPLTQSFGIALAEAAMLGLICVSTNVGGVEQAIPAQSLYSARTNPQNLMSVLNQAIKNVRNNQKIPQINKQFKYPWPDVCQRTVQLYQFLMSKPRISTQDIQYSRDIFCIISLSNWSYIFFSIYMNKNYLFSKFSTECQFANIFFDYSFFFYCCNKFDQIMFQIANQLTVKFKLMLKNYLIHKRNTSQSIKLDSKPKANITNLKSSKSSMRKPKSNTLSLIQKSIKKIPSKQIVVQNLDQSQQNGHSPFFAFGQRVNGQKNWNMLDVDKITQVQDSNSRRQFTSHRSARGPSNYSKQNYNTSNFDDGLRKSTKSKSNKQKSKDRSNKSRNQKTKSTISLSRVKNNKQLQLRTQKMQKSVKMLWECMGQLWENSRVSQYKSQKNNQSITGLKRKLEQQQQKILEIKFQISKSFKNNQKTHTGLRA